MSATSDKVQIDAPELMSGPERTRDTVFTAIMWGVYLYLWVPLISLFAWVLGFEFAYDVMIRLGGAADLGEILIFYGVIVLIIFLVVTAWSLGNRLRYGKLHRRHAGDALSIAEMAHDFGVDECEVERLRTRRSVAIDFDENGRPVIR